MAISSIDERRVTSIPTQPRAARSPSPKRRSLWSQANWIRTRFILRGYSFTGSCTIPTRKNALKRNRRGRYEACAMDSSSDGRTCGQRTQRRLLREPGDRNSDTGRDILPGQSKAEEFTTLVHELAHEMLHKAERRTTTTKVVKETEAGAIAFIIGKAVGLETGSASADYIHLYHGNSSLLIESLEVIQKTSAVILSALKPAFTEMMADAELAQVA